MTRRIAQSCISLMLVIFCTHSSQALAQDDAKKDMPADSQADQSTEPAPSLPMDQMPGLEAAPGTIPSEGVPQPKVQASKEKNMLVWALESSGIVGFILLAMSVLALGLTFKFIMEMRLEKAMPPDLVAAFEGKIRDKKYQEAYDVARNSPSFLGKVLAAGLSKLSAGYPQAVEAMQEVGEDESMRQEHRLSWLAILGTTGPLLGLLGTVEGIIRSFQTIATSETQPKPNELAGGISTSLFNTFEGLLVAIIATVAFMLLKNQAARLALEVGMVSGNLMSRLSTVVRPSRGASTGATIVEG